MQKAGIVKIQPRKIRFYLRYRWAKDISRNSKVRTHQIISRKQRQRNGLSKESA